MVYSTRRASSTLSMLIEVLTESIVPTARLHDNKKHEWRNLREELDTHHKFTPHKQLAFRAGEGLPER